MCIRTVYSFRRSAISTPCLCSAAVPVEGAPAAQGMAQGERGRRPRSRRRKLLKWMIEPEGGPRPEGLATVPGEGLGIDDAAPEAAPEVVRPYGRMSTLYSAGVGGK
ncbi:hypothetical protein EVAR_48426_1 [Eumeta japonica]|uniref:Uncharacterized protein n=1 Tax=Eumeta variegata TaxID=151549 RepID=A0A4C1XRP7_EUMVA|nr:hypothetical protein EVAR_48426_1 [Eumeta japonica]